MFEVFQFSSRLWYQSSWFEGGGAVFVYFLFVFSYPIVQIYRCTHILDSYSRTPRLHCLKEKLMSNTFHHRHKFRVKAYFQLEEERQRDRKTKNDKLLAYGTCFAVLHEVVIFGISWGSMQRTLATNVYISNLYWASILSINAILNNAKSRRH